MAHIADIFTCLSSYLHCIHKLDFHILHIHQYNLYDMDTLKILGHFFLMIPVNYRLKSMITILLKTSTYSQYKQWILCYSLKDIPVLRMLMSIPYILPDILMNIFLPKEGH